MDKWLSSEWRSDRGARASSAVHRQHGGHRHDRPQLELVDLSEDNDRVPMWSGLSVEFVDPPLPIALERDDAKDVALEYTLIFNAGADGLDASEFARRLAGLRAVNMTIVWAYRRPKLPSLRKRGTLVRRQPITIAADTLRQSCIVGWQDNPRWHYLVDTAQGREPPAN